MSSLYNYQFTRYGKRGQSGFMSCTAMDAMTAEAYAYLRDAEWVALDSATSDLPPHKWSQSGFKDTYDAAKFCGDYSDGRQMAYACAVSYTIKLPQDAYTGTAATLEAITATLDGDRWLSDGAVLSVILSDDAVPPSWDEVLGAQITTPDPVTEEDDAESEWVAPLRKLTRANDGADSSCEAILPVNATAKAYAHIILRLGNYLTHTGAWIEGGALLRGETLTLAFDRDILPDPEEPTEVEAIPDEKMAGFLFPVKTMVPDSDLYNKPMAQNLDVPLLYTQIPFTIPYRVAGKNVDKPYSNAKYWPGIAYNSIYLNRENYLQYGKISMAGIRGFSPFIKSGTDPDTIKEDSPETATFKLQISYPKSSDAIEDDGAYNVDGSGEMISHIYNKKANSTAMVLIVSPLCSGGIVDGIVFKSKNNQTLLPASDKLIYRYRIYKCYASEIHQTNYAYFYFNIYDYTRGSFSSAYNFLKLLNGRATFEGKYTKFKNEDIEDAVLSWIPIAGSNELTLLATGDMETFQTNTVYKADKTFTLPDDDSPHPYMLVFHVKHTAELDVDSETGYPVQSDFGGEFKMDDASGIKMGFHLV